MSKGGDRLDKPTATRARAIFAEWLERTGDHRLAAERAGVSERTGRRWRALTTARRSSIAPRVAMSRTNLRAEPTRWVGRESALSGVRALFTQGARIVTITGPGGIGKTRLATRFADIYANDYLDGGAWLCDLSDARTEEDVIASIATALGVVLGADGNRAEQLGHAIASRGHVLLVLDNFEQVEPEATPIVSVFAGLASRAHFLVTSRAQLRLAGEAVWTLDALELPDADEEDTARILSSEAALLFVDRARLACAGWEPSTDDALAIRDLVLRLDGLPLAIELCAARLAILPPRELLARMNQRFELLVARSRGTTTRQASMRATIDASWDLLSDAEKNVLAQCSVFRGGFSVDAVENIAAGTPNALDVVQGLVEKSLVCAREAGAAHGRELTGTTRRLVMFESIHAYASERLAELDAEGATRDRHARWFAAEATRWAFEAPSSRTARDRLWLEIENVAAAEEHAVASKLVDIALGLALAMSTSLHPRGLFAREIAALDAALALEGGAAGLRARALAARATARRVSGKNEHALADALAAEAIAKNAGDGVIAVVMTALGAVHHAMGQTTEAERAYASALDAAARAADPAVAAAAHARLALLHRLRRCPEEALSHADRALRDYREIGNERMQADVLAVIATLHQSGGRFAEARAAYEAALAILERGAEPGLLATVLANLATLDHELGDLPKARAGAERALAVFRSLGIRRQEGCVLGNIAGIHAEMGRLEEARMRFEEALGLLRATGDRVHDGIFTAQLGATLAQLDDLEGAERMFEAAKQTLAPADDDPLGVSLEAQTTFLLLARARRAARSGDHETAVDLRAEAMNVVEKIADAAASDDVRVALRVLRRELGRPIPGGGPTSARGALVVADEAREVRVPSGIVISLAQRRAPRLILARLLEEREKKPGAVLGVEELLDAGWPGERVLAEAGASRVYVALGTLRKLGLRDVLLSRDGGYLLDPRIAIVRVPEL